MLLLSVENKGEGLLFVELNVRLSLMRKTIMASDLWVHAWGGGAGG